MKKIQLSLLLGVSSILQMNAQQMIGIRTDKPKTSLTLGYTEPVSANTTFPDGIIIPQLTLTHVVNKTRGCAYYNADQIGTLIYITDISGTTDQQTSLISEAGSYYYFDGDVWQPIRVPTQRNTPWNLVGTEDTPASASAGNATPEIYVKSKSVSIGDSIPLKLSNGNYAGLSVINGDLAIGSLRVSNGTKGQANVYIGDLAGNGTGNYNISIGQYSGANFTTASNNVLIQNTTTTNTTTSHTTGSNNIVLQPTSGVIISTGNNNILLGRYATAPDPTTIDFLNIGNIIKGKLPTSTNKGGISIGKLQPDTDVTLDLGLPNSTSLQVERLRYIDGNQATGRILGATDTSGNVAWLDPSTLTTTPTTMTFKTKSVETTGKSLVNNRGMNTGIEVTLPANTNYLVEVNFSIKIDYQLKTYLEKDNNEYKTENIWVRYIWGDATNATSPTIDAKVGQLVSVNCTPIRTSDNKSEYQVRGTTLISNTSDHAKTYHLVGGDVDFSNIAPQTDINSIKYTDTFDGSQNNICYATLAE